MFIGFATVMYAMPHAKKLVAKEKSTMQTAVSKVMFAPNYKTFQSGKDIVKYLVENKIYKPYFNPLDQNTVLVEKQGPYFVILSFEKGGICSLEDKNCFVKYYIKSGKEPELKNKLYFDEEGITEFDSTFNQ